MKTISEWFDEYSDSHQNKTNKLIHWVCVPTIYFSIIGILAHFSALLTDPATGFGFYLLCTPRSCFGSSDGYVDVGHGLAHLDSASRYRFLIALFVLAWIGQFYGHKVEGKKPSFFKDLQIPTSSAQFGAWMPI